MLQHVQESQKIHSVYTILLPHLVKSTQKFRTANLDIMQKLVSTVILTQQRMIVPSKVESLIVVLLQQPYKSVWM